MKKISVLVCMLIAIIMIGSCSSTKKGNMIVEINGYEVTDGDLDFLGTINPRIKAQLMNPEAKKKLLDNIVDQELLYQEAVKQGINRRQDVRDKVDLYRRVIIAQALLDEELKKSAKKYYDEHPEEFQKLDLAQIMISYENPPAGDKKQSKKAAKGRSEKDALKLANEIKERLDKGEDFAALAKEYSDDSATKNRGGELGLVSKDDKKMEARGYGPLLEKAFAMKVGEISGPVKTNKGYHIITVTKGAEQLPYDQVENNILFTLKDSTRFALLKELKNDAKIVYADDGKKQAKSEKTTVTPQNPEKTPDVKIEVKPTEDKSPATEQKNAGK